MKHLPILILALILGIAQSLCGKVPLDTEPQRVYLDPEKKQQIIEVAKKVCAVHAPDIDISVLTPVLYSFPDIYKDSTIRDNEIVSVRFMKDSTDIDTFDVFARGTLKRRTLHRPKSVIRVEVYTETLEPAGIGTYYGTIFRPDYETFRKQYPGAIDWLKNKY